VNEDEVTKGKKRTRRRLTVLERMHEDCNHDPEGHAAAAATAALASGYTEGMRQEQPDETKSARDMAASATNARGGGGTPSVGSYSRQRTAGGNGRVAVGTHYLVQSNPGVTEVLATLRTARGNVQDIGFGPDSNVPGGFSHAGEVALHLFDAAGNAGSFPGMMPVSGDPQRPASHQVPTGCDSNGSHSVFAGVESSAVSNKSRKDLMKEMLFPRE
jgi:hypothetical protein